MNRWHDEYLAEFHRAELIQDARLSHKDHSYKRNTRRRSTWFTLKMFGLANWMISTGVRMRKRYETPARGCGHKSASYYA